jgi:hypothetical protein
MSVDIHQSRDKRINIADAFSTNYEVRGKKLSKREEE